MNIDVYADVACPWCYIGHARLKDALRERDDVTATVKWNPFQLQPDMPEEGREWRAFAEEKFGGWERAQKMFERVEEAAEMEGLPVDFDAMTTAPNTEDAHRLVLWAEASASGNGTAPESSPVGESPGERMAERLYRAYFAEGVNVSDRDALVDLAAQAGFDAGAAREMLDAGTYAEAVEESQERARTFNIRGVPCYVFGDRFALSGAQPPAKIHQAIDAALEA
jgi:predicted DsbA family dithiol-disulfide isomerase